MGRIYKDTNDYITTQAVETRVLLEELRQTIRMAAPRAEEVISYNMPAYKYHGILVYFAAHKSHIGFYPTPSGIEAFRKELSGYEWAKGSVQFSFDKPLPLNLVTKIVKFRVKENLEKAENKLKNGHTYSVVAK